MHRIFFAVAAMAIATTAPAIAESNRFLAAFNGGQAGHESAASAPTGSILGTWGGNRDWNDGCMRGGGCKVPKDVTDGIVNATLAAADPGVTPGLPPALPGTVYGSSPEDGSGGCHCGVANNDTGFNSKGGNSG